ncbi:unnamed protein product (macronuclear) [Paramecium tetraurelia]|uniref:DNA helicase n=1 Tax=Paramecium tetraurelia TaxID=5888 RepID=A0BKB5_PARTE|nr:uncharacterized protein GSPATT00029613001 [Paramecium tetraurelia]CAK58982.1 unnamed protein product [Paramecium tetraurelia]|eukprot:XP_001426380.1 hypothetical protein (macronuclear) [Paramecium tetraurelia strain d4-2]
MASQVQNNKDYNHLLTIWNDYFNKPAKETIDLQDNVHNMIILFYKLFQENDSIIEYQHTPNLIECKIDIQQLFKLIDDGEQLQSLFINDPQDWINSISLAISSLNNNKKVICRLHNIPLSKKLASQDIGKYIAIMGTIITTGSSKLLLERACFVCISCDEYEKYYVNSDGSIPKVNQCNKCGSSNTMKLDRNRSDAVLYQKIKLNELQIEVELRDLYVNCFMSGDEIIVHGIVKTIQDEQKSSLYVKYIQAYHVKHEQINESFTRHEIKTVNDLAKSGELFYALINNFCPSIYGHEIVKAGLLLSLVGGSTCNRNASHCLLVGDPGQGKSQLLKFAHLLSTRSIYVSGTAVSQCGLTCSVNHKNDDTIIDAGALVLADNGVCCLDEIDKMQSQHYALLEAMEQQTITLAKSAVMCQFYARTTIIATANPAQGHFNKTKSLIENLKIQNTLLSRFDLIYLLIDEPDMERDQKLSEHIMNFHNMKTSRIKFNNTDDVKTPNAYRTLNERLHSNQINQELPYQLMKKIIAHVKNIKSVLTLGAQKLIASYYLKIRQTAFGMPITSRQLESLIRLSQAKAKLCLRQEVTEEDAQFAIDIFEESRFDCFISGLGNQSTNKKGQASSINNSKNIGTLSKPKQTQIFLDELHKVSLQKDSYEFSMEELKNTARKINLQVGDLGDFISKLNYDCMLIMRGNNVYELNYKR